MFQLNEAEFANLNSQIVTSSWSGLRRAAMDTFDRFLKPFGNW